MHPSALGWLLATKVYSGTGADIVMESIELTPTESLATGRMVGLTGSWPETGVVADDSSVQPDRSGDCGLAFRQLEAGWRFLNGR